MQRTNFLSRLSRVGVMLPVVLALIVPVYAGGAKDKKGELRISKQYGVGYLPLIVLEGHKLIEKNAKEAGLGDISVLWVTHGGGATANEALISGSVDFISGGIAPSVRLWDKTEGGVRALAAIDQTSLSLNTSNPNIKTLRDFTDKDRIAVPSVKVSIQSLVLQKAAANEFGIKDFEKLDYLTVSLPHPDALIALTSGRSEVDAHFASEPYKTLELQNPKIHSVIESYDVFGGRHSFNLLTTSTKFYDANPKLIAVVLQSLKEADDWINSNKAAAAQLYLDVTKSSEPVELILEIINKPDIGYSVTPLNITAFSDFLYETGEISKKPVETDLFFPDVYKLGK